MSAFERLSPALQYHVANSLLWPSLRPVQEHTIPAVLDGHNCVVLAPTAGGKTEAAMFPVLSLADTENRAAVSALYIAPIRALLNNQETRLQRLASFVGRKAFKWHGDVGTSQRKRFIDDPADILAITPESLEAMLVSRKTPARRILGNVQVVVIDEVHAFAADDRGAHLVSLLERIQHLCGRDIQRVGLSATVGNPDDVCAWLAGSSQRPRVVINPGGAVKEAELSLDFVGNLANAATVISKLHPGTKRLVFADSRGRVEELGDLLTKQGMDAYVSHSSLAASERHAAERAFADGQSCVIVATSALELGIDIGDLDHVLQIDAPTTVSSFLQRMGRTGRRDDTFPNCTFLATKDWQLIQAAALLRMHARGYVEPVQPVRRGAHILAHQLMAMSLQYGGVPTADWWNELKGSAAFAGLTQDDRQELVDHMLAENILVHADGRYILGERGEKLYGGKNFMDLYVVFSTPRLFKVMWGPREIGSLDGYFVQQKEASELHFVLAGKPWRATHVDWKRGVCYVEPAPSAGKARWAGAPRLLSRDLCQAVREVLVDDVEDPWWSKRARESLAGLRVEYDFLRTGPAPMIEDGDRIRWWTFAGGKANNLMAQVLESKLGSSVSANNFAVTMTEGAALSVAGVRAAIDGIEAELTPEAALRFAGGCARGRISKFQACLSERLEVELIAEAMVDLEGALAATASERPRGSNPGELSSPDPGTHHGKGNKA